MGFFDIVKKVYEKSFDKFVETTGQIENYQMKVSSKSDAELVRIIKDSTAPAMLRSVAKQEYESRRN